jgi:hypothetical protein
MRKIWKWVIVSFALIVATIGGILTVVSGRKRPQDTDSNNTQEAKNEMYSQVGAIARDPDPDSRAKRVDDYISEGYE